jgi:hypothetical protein
VEILAKPEADLAAVGRELLELVRKAREAA